MQVIDNILDFPCNSIYGFKGPNKSFYLFHSSNSLFELAKTLTDLRDGVHKSNILQEMYNARSLELVLCKEYSDNASPYTVRAEFTEYVEQLEKEGWENLRGEYKAGEFKLKAYVYTLPKTKTPLFYVIAESKRKENIVLGVFATIDEGKAWIANVYPNGTKGRIVPYYAENDLTQEYHKTHGVKLL
jgi:hypothetical protein